MLFDRIFQMKKKNKKGKHIKSRNIYFEQDLHSAFTVLSNIRVIKRKVTSGKISVLLFISLKCSAWECSFFPMFYVKDFF